MKKRNLTILITSIVILSLCGIVLSLGLLDNVTGKITSVKSGESVNLKVGEKVTVEGSVIKLIAATQTNIAEIEVDNQRKSLGTGVSAKVGKFNIRIVKVSTEINPLERKVDLVVSLPVKDIKKEEKKEVKPVTQMVDLKIGESKKVGENVVKVEWISQTDYITISVGGTSKDIKQGSETLVGGVKIRVSGFSKEKKPENRTVSLVLPVVKVEPKKIEPKKVEKVKEKPVQKLPEKREEKKVVAPVKKKVVKEEGFFKRFFSWLF